MTPDVFLHTIIDTGLDFLAGIGGPPLSDDARRELLAIAMQESGPQLNARYQGSPSASPGPARGFWQFEAGGGVKGVLTHPASQTWMRNVCGALTVVAEQNAVWRALEGNDILSSAVARLLLYTDARPLPKTQQDGWDQYFFNWRPGKPHPDEWPNNWAAADAAVRGGLVA